MLRYRSHLLSPAIWRQTALIAALAVAMLGIGPAGNAAALSGNHKLVVVLCKFTDSTNEPKGVSYFQTMFSATGAGTTSVFDYWKETSYGQLDLTGSVVKGWYTVDMTVAEWTAAGRNAKIDACAKKAKGDVDFNDFAGVVVLTNKSYPNEDLFGAGPPRTIDGTTYPNTGIMLAAWDAQFNGILHESGHSFGFNHSRKVTQTTDQIDYGDYFDVMSCLGCIGTTSTYGVGTQGGPGLNVVQLDTAGWIAPNRITTVDNSTCGQQTIGMAALNHAEAPGLLEARIPASAPIVRTGSLAGLGTTTDRFALELRERSAWDGGIPQDGVLVHVHGQDGYSYWVDRSAISGFGTYYTPGGGTPPGTFTGDIAPLRAGNEYVDPTNKLYVAVNRIDRSSHTGTVTVGGCKLNASLGGLTPTSADFGDVVTLSSTLSVTGGSTPIPGQKITLSLGSQSCNATTQASGVGSCGFTINQHPGTYTLSSAFAGDPAYNSDNNSTPFTINKEATKLTYDGATTADYHDAFTASAALSETDSGAPVGGKSVTFTLGSGDTCTATTDSLGTASCSITPTQQPGASTIKAEFGPDTDYESSSDSKPFTITREQTTTVFSPDPPSRVLYGGNLTLGGRLTEDDTPPLAGRTLTFTIGSGSGAQSCTTPATDADGHAGCTITNVRQPEGPQPIRVGFGGDAYYLDSSSVLSIRVYSARSDKQDVLAAVNGLIPTAQKPDQDKLKDISKHLTGALAPAKWAADGNHLTPKTGDSVFDDEKVSVARFLDIIKRGVIPSGTIQPLIAQLVEADTILADTSIADAVAGGGTPSKITEARNERTRATTSFSLGKTVEGIDHLKKAWHKGQEALHLL